MSENAIQYFIDLLCTLAWALPSLAILILYGARGRNQSLKEQPNDKRPARHAQGN